MLKIILKVLIVCSFLISGASHASDYKLAAGDTIRISVYGEEDLSFDELLIDSSENFEFPYLGNISAKDKTLREVQEELTSGLKGDYLVNPKVTVSIVEYRNIYVNGVVNKPGAYEYQPDLSVEKAIALAGGFLAKYRKTKGVYLTKSEEVKGLTQNEIKDLLEKKSEVDLTAEVHPGDTIYVVSSFW
ncbi:sugar transporter [Vibrio albus]|uniref:Sugar transporter n=1 Tax=Vibrio albus TaxID=2200953 RepID=A0A2U3BDE6_9VIBR|nr:polysaccharide biosynthesis/export family protein [Vibrio albus]PWI34811.1 sugar transporter [Vibrio albus]